MVAGCPDLNGQAAHYSRVQTLIEVHYNQHGRAACRPSFLALAILPFITSY